MRTLREKAKRLLHETIKSVAPHMNLDSYTDTFVDLIIKAAVEEAVQQIASLSVTQTANTVEAGASVVGMTIESL